MLIVASIVRITFPIVPLFPREKTNLNMKAFWQSILVLVAKHYANALLVICASLGISWICLPQWAIDLAMNVYQHLVLFLDKEI